MMLGVSSYGRTVHTLSEYRILRDGSPSAEMSWSHLVMGYELLESSVDKYCTLY